MNDTIVTVVGNVVDSPRRVNTAGGAVTNFRMASTARRYDPRTEQFVDSGTFWVDVECWNSLSGNVSASVCKGDPVIVHGTLSTHSWDSENGPRSKPQIKAFAVGPNLSKGRSLFTRDKSGRGTQQPEGEVTEAPSPDGLAEGAPMSVEEPQAGRDYMVEGEAFQEMDADLPREPAHA